MKDKYHEIRPDRRTKNYKIGRQEGYRSGYATAEADLLKKLDAPFFSIYGEKDGSRYFKQTNGSKIKNSDGSVVYGLESSRAIHLFNQNVHLRLPLGLYRHASIKEIDLNLLKTLQEEVDAGYMYEIKETEVIKPIIEESA
jgi:hypothetical protein